MISAPITWPCARARPPELSHGDFALGLAVYGLDAPGPVAFVVGGSACRRAEDLVGLRAAQRHAAALLTSEPGKRIFGQQKQKLDEYPVALHFDLDRSVDALRVNYERRSPAEFGPTQVNSLPVQLVADHWADAVLDPSYELGWFLS